MDWLAEIHARSGTEQNLETSRATVRVCKACFQTTMKYDGRTQSKSKQHTLKPHHSKFALVYIRVIGCIICGALETSNFVSQVCDAPDPLELPKPQNNQSR
eukprot:4063458-Amphidinium_carterae.1